MRIIFAMKETLINRYSVEVPKKLENSSNEELLAWVNSGDVFNEPIKFEKNIDIIESESATDYQFEIVK